MATFKVVLIAGATGFVGKLIAEAFLEKKSFDVRILTRHGVTDDKKKQILHELSSKGAHLVEGSTDDIESLKKALHGVDLVVSAFSGQACGQPQLNLVKAAKEAGVKRFIPSEYGFDVEAPAKHGITVDFFSPKIAVREELRKLNLEHVLLITGGFAAYTLTPFFGVDVEHGKVRSGGTGKEKFAVTHVPDFARAVPDIATHPNAGNKTVYIEGDFVSFDDIAHIVEEATGKKLERQYVSVAELKKSIAESQNPVHKFQEQLQLCVALNLFNQKGDYHQYSKQKISSLKEVAHA